MNELRLLECSFGIFCLLKNFVSFPNINGIRIKCYDFRVHAVLTACTVLYCTVIYNLNLPGFNSNLVEFGKRNEDE